MPPVLPSPSDFSAPEWAAWGFLFYAGALVVLLALPWTLSSGLRRHDWLPFTLLVSGFLCSLAEPMLDFLGHLRWADNLIMTGYRAFGIEIPLLIPPCYAAFLGLEGYFVYTMLKKGMTARQGLLLFAACGLSDAVMETPGLTFKVYEYYGVQPFTFLNFPYWWGFINGASIFTVGFLLWFLEPRLRGARRAWLLLASPTGMMIAYFVCGWPHLLAHNSAAPVWLRWAMCAVTMAACVGWVRFLAGFAAVPEPVVHWTLPRMFLYRFLPPAQRARILAGLDVLVVEAHPTPGGMTATNPMAPEAPEYQINEASIQASLFRTTRIDQELGLSRRYGLKQTVIDPAHFQLAADGSSLGLWRDPRRTADELRRFSRKDAQALLELYRVIDAAVEIGLPLTQTSVARPEIGSILKAARALMKNRGELLALGRWMTSSQVEAVEESFEHDMIRAPLLTSLPFMPFDADLSGWSLIYLGVLSKYGVAMFHGGTQSLPNALIRCVEEHGGRILTGTPVERLTMAGERVTGVRLRGGEEITARRGVLTACSPRTTLTRLLPDGVLTGRLKVRADHIPTKLRGITDYKLNIALSGKIRMTRHEKWRGDGIDLRLACNCFHTYEEVLQAARDCVRGDVPAHVPGLAQVTTAFDPSMAPPGCDTFWFWSGLTPGIPRIGWPDARKQLTERVIRDAEQYYQGIESLEVARRDLAQPDLEERFWAIDGSVYHVDPTLTRFGPGKPAAGFAGYETPVPGLFLTGSGTHPVAGISGMPGQNAAKTMLKVFRAEDKGGRLYAAKVRRKRERARRMGLRAAR